MSKESLAAATVEAAPLHAVQTFAEAPPSPAPAIPLRTSFSKKPASEGSTPEAQSAEILPLHFNQKNPIATTESLPLIASAPGTADSTEKLRDQRVRGGKGRFSAEQHPILALPTHAGEAGASVSPTESEPATSGNASSVLTPEAREAMVRSVLEEGLTPSAAARRFNTTWKTVNKWINRYKETATVPSAAAIVPTSAEIEVAAEVTPTTKDNSVAEPKSRSTVLSAEVRDGIVRSVLEEGLSVLATALRFNTTDKTVAKWVKRHKEAAQAADSTATAQENAKIEVTTPEATVEAEPAVSTAAADRQTAVSGRSNRISPEDREAIARSVLEEGLSVLATALRFNTTDKTVAKWVKRHKEAAQAATKTQEGLEPQLEIEALAVAETVSESIAEIADGQLGIETSTPAVAGVPLETPAHAKRLSPDVREAVVRSVLQDGLTPAAAARRFNTTWKTVTKWLKRHKETEAGIKENDAVLSTSLAQPTAELAPTSPTQPGLFASEPELGADAKDSYTEEASAALEHKPAAKGRLAANRTKPVQQMLPIGEPEVSSAGSIEAEPELSIVVAATSGEVVALGGESVVEIQSSIVLVTEQVEIEPTACPVEPLADPAPTTNSSEPMEVSTVQAFEPITSQPAEAIVEASRSGEVIEFPANDMAAAKESFPAFQQRLREFYGHDIYTAWFHLLKIDSMVGSKLVLSVPTRFLKSWIQSHYIDDLLKIWREDHPGVTVIELQDRSRIVARPAVQTSTDPKARSAGGSVSHLERPSVNPDRVAARTSLDARHTFETFVCGESNRLAHNAAKLAASPDAVNNSAFNPLYIHGGVGLGKTHLLQAIAAANPGRALYVTAESFMYNFIGTMRNRGLDLKHVLANVDILLMDDLQFLQGKGTVTDLALIVNAMIDAGRQVIVAADRSPGQLDCQDERLASRLKSGYCVEIGNPEEETRLGILSSHLKTDHPSLSISEELKQQLANAIVTTGRDLVGALNHLATAARLANTTIVTPEMTEAAVRQITEAQPARRVRIEDIQKVVARFYKITKDDMISARRTANVVRPRQIAIYLAKILTLRSLPEIGRRFGGRDHTTILHAVRKIEDLMGKDEAMENDVSTLKKLIGCPA